MRCLALSMILLLSSCGAQFHLKQAIKKDPTILQKRTITVTDTVVTEPIAVRDTVTISQIDTVEIIKDKFRVKIMRSFDTLIIDGGCDADTIVRTVEVPIETVVYNEKDTLWQRIQAFGFYILLLLVGVRVLQKLAERYIP